MYVSKCPQIEILKGQKYIFSQRKAQDLHLSVNVEEAVKQNPRKKEPKPSAP